MTEENARHFCMVPVPGQVQGKTKAAILNEFRWEPGTQITVAFLEGDPDLRRRVAEVAKTWTGPQMANLDLKFVDGEDADIRVAFEQGDGSWSYLGTMSKDISPPQPTMNFGWLTPDSADSELRVVLHEFGHALGLIHEHQNPIGSINWNRAAVIADLSGPPNRWDEATIEHNIFKKYDPAEVDATDVDNRSIMMYPIPAAWTTDGFSAGLNRTLSETDKEFIHDAYPW